jgi:hypothetical protein
VGQVPPRGNDTGQRPQQPQQPANRENDRNHNREGDRARQGNEAEGAARPAAAARQKRKTPVNKLTLYMRGVAVLALLIIGGVGVYKGRAMLNAKEGEPKIAQVPDDGKSPEFKPVEGKPSTVKPLEPGSAVPSFSPNVNTAKPGDKPGDAKKPSALLAALNKEKEKSGAAPVVDAKPTVEKKSSGLGGFKFGDKNKREEKPVKPAKPALASPAESGSGYSLSDTNPSTSSNGEYSAAPAAPTEYGGYGDPSAPNASGPIVTKPAKPASKLPRGVDYGATGDTPAYSLNDTPSATEGYSAGDANPAVVTTPNEGGYEGVAEAPVVDPAAAAKPKALSGLGSPPKNPLPKTSSGLGTT